MSPSAPGTQARTIAASSPASSRPNRRARIPGRPRNRWTRSSAGERRSLRSVATASTCSPARWSATYSSTASESGSAQCRSSSTTTRVRPPAARRSTRSTGLGADGVGLGGDRVGGAGDRRRQDRVEGRQPRRQLRVASQRMTAGRLEQDLRPRPVGRAPAAGDGPALQHDGLVITGDAEDLPHQPGLADPGLAHHGDEPAGPALGGGECPPQTVEFGVPPDHDRAEHLDHGSSMSPDGAKI